PHYGGSVLDTIPLGDPNNSFSGATPHPHNVWGSISFGLIRSDGRSRSVTLVPNVNGVDGPLKMTVTNSSIGGAGDPMAWHVRY
ncbi:MAG TPA: hypothetical protein PLJ21_03270, partial [Pseudobdellovibrionaceae bacterium]|nr:hypothetical protein [Pseudobdellovibrionaceae bacterium]